MEKRLVAARSMFKVGLPMQPANMANICLPPACPVCPSQTYLPDRDYPFALGRLIRTLSPSATNLKF